MQDDELRKAGLKVTVPRIKILEIFESAPERHLSAEEIYTMLKESDEQVGLATVYRVLTQFEVAGILRRHNFESGHAVYELDRGEHHDHLVCLKCGLVREFLDDEIERRQATIAANEGFVISDHNLTLYGACSACQQK